MRKIILLLFIAWLCPIGLLAQSFTYNYKGVDFKVKIKENKAVIRSFDRDVAKVVIPAQVTDERGRSYPVFAVDLNMEATIYQTNLVALETGIVQIEDYCFWQFKRLSTIYIPKSIEKIGKKAFNSKYAPTFKMPSTIKESDLLAGNIVYPKMSHIPVENPLASLDMSDYGEDKHETPQQTLAVQTPAPKSVTPGTSDIDYNIPSTGMNRENTFCIIVANEEYQQQDTPNVKYAVQDGKTFHTYCTRTLGLPRDNIRMVSNASYLQMKSMLDWFKQLGEVYGKDSNFIVYYSGHGIPDERGNCKLIPSDVSINDVNNGLGLNELYSSLGNLTTRSVLVLIDACFSGNDREDVAAIDDKHRGIVREVKAEQVTGDVVVLTAASGTETALCYEEKAHGLFSYYLMKKLQETKGDVTYGDLYDYVKREVMRKSVVSKGKKQTPSVTFSSQMQSNWKNIKF